MVGKTSRDREGADPTGIGNATVRSLTSTFKIAIRSSLFSSQRDGLTPAQGDSPGLEEVFIFDPEGIAH